MKNNYYLLKNGILKRKENTIYFINKEEKRIIPINNIYSIYAYGRISFTSGVISYLSKKGIVIHFYDYYGNYEGSFYPKETLLSGELLIKQAENCLKFQKRLFLAKKFIEGAIQNIIKNLKTYSKNTDIIQGFLIKLYQANNISDVMAIEGNMRKYYYQQLDEILPQEFRIEKREKRPPTNNMNALISFGNSLLYGTIITEIYNTQLNPTISYLHEPSNRRFSLALDISEIFKPIIVDRIILKLVNKGIIKEEHFRKELNNVMLNEKGKRIFIKEYEIKLKSTITHKKLKRKVSYRQLIRLELYKLIKHILGMEEYTPFVIWW